jgi:hypothetical protein
LEPTISSSCCHGKLRPAFKRASQVVQHKATSTQRIVMPGNGALPRWHAGHPPCLESHSEELTMTERSNTSHQPRLLAQAGPLPRSLALRLVSLTGAVLTTALLLGSQWGLAHHYTAQADAQQLAAARARVLTQRHGAPAASGGPQHGGQTVPAVGVKKTT